jgi:hypothetical protein
MEPLNSKSAEQRLSQLCAQLETCRSVDDVQRTLSELEVPVVSGSQAETVLCQLLAATQAKGLTELVLASAWHSTIVHEVVADLHVIFSRW